MPNLLEIRNLTAAYGEVQVLWDVSLTVAAGEVVALVGANGAGKTTLLKVISGLLPVRSGSLRFQGQPLERSSSEAIVSRGVVHVPEGRHLFPQMSVEENLLMGAYHRRDGGVREDLERIYHLLPRLAERRRQPAGSLSGGEQQMAAVARGLMGKPQLLLIDEMSLGLAPIIVDDLIEVIRQIHAQGTTVLLVEQDVQLALANADRGYVLETGRITLSGPARELLRHEGVRKAYLGL